MKKLASVFIFLLMCLWLLVGCSSNKKQPPKEHWEEVISKAYIVYIRQSDQLMKRYIKEHTELLNTRTLTQLLESLQQEYHELSKGKIDNFLITTTCQAVGMAILEARYPLFSKTILKTKNINDTMRNICYYNDDSSKEAIYNMLDAAWVPDD